MRVWPTSLAVVCIALASIPASDATSQRGTPEVRSVHELAAFATVRIRVGSTLGTGWLLRQSGRPVVVTNRHVVPRRGRVQVGFYQGSERGMATGTAHLIAASQEVDLSVLALEADPPETARSLEIEDGDIVRGERVVLGGNPNMMLFQTSEGVVTGHVPDSRWRRECGEGRNCIAIDASSFVGSSGGAVLNRQGRVVGMLWGGPGGVAGRTARGVPVWLQNPTFAFAIHCQVLREELQRINARRQGR